MSSKPAVRPRPPSVEAVLTRLRASANGTDPAALSGVAPAVVDKERANLAAGAAARDPEALAAEALGRLGGFAEPGLIPVINATGVIIHTNLGRAPWPNASASAVADLTQHALLLELDRETGRRGARARAAEEHLVSLTGAEDALVTNNNAAAVALAVALVGRGGIAVSRGEPFEIGGGVRIPDIIRRSGAKLVEVGTTNRTRAADFEGPLADGRAKAVLRVHPSNFAMAGFTEAPDQREVADLAHSHGAVVIDDLGSGALLDTAAFGLAHEPLPSERLAAGSDVVMFSGDKLVVGRADLIARMRRDPLARAMRPDKATMIGVAMTLGLYRAGRATAEIPIWQMIAAQLETLRARGDALAAQSGPSVEVVEVRSTIGGGSLPGETLQSIGLALTTGSANRMLNVMGSGPP